MSVQEIRHVDIFFPIRRDYQRVAKIFVRGQQGDLFASGLNSLELIRAEQIRVYRQTGVNEITDEMLWISMPWHKMSAYALHHYSERSFEAIVDYMIASECVRRRYVKCTRFRKGEPTEFVQEHGHLLTYASKEEAEDDQLHHGKTVLQLLLCTDVVNSLIAEIYHLPPPPDIPPDPSAAQHKSEQSRAPKSGDAQRTKNHAEQSPRQKSTARGGNLVTAISVSTIQQSAQICADNPSFTRTNGQSLQTCGGKSARIPMQTCTDNPRKLAGNKNKNLSESLLVESNSAAGAINPLANFDFTQDVTKEAILDLNRLLLPPLPDSYKSLDDRQKALERIEGAAATLAANNAVQQGGLRHLARRLCYMADELSPCSWRLFCRGKNPGFVVRLWHLSDSEFVLRYGDRELLASDWWPSWEAENSWSMPDPSIIDLAELSGEISSAIGMEVELAQIIEEYLSPILSPHGYGVRLWPLGSRYDPRGFAVEISWVQPNGGGTLRFYDPAQWGLIIAAEEVACLGSPEFIEILSRSLRAGQVA